MDILPDWYHNDDNVELPELYNEAYSLDAFRWYILGRNMVKPIVPNDNWYEVMVDLFVLCDFLNIWHVMRPLDRQISDIFMRDNLVYDTYQPEVNIMLCLFEIRHSRRLHKFLDRINKQHDDDETKNHKKDLINEYNIKIPYCLRYVIPNRKRELYHIAYPMFDIKCVERFQLQSMKIVNTTPKYGMTYAVKYDTLMQRLIKHLPSVLTGSEFPWKVSGASCCIAGGFLQCLSNNVLYEEDTYKTSDVDLFIMGYEEKSRELLENVMSLLKSRGYEFTYNNNVINATPEEGNVIQIICTLNRDPYDIITTFDNSSVQIAYDGEDIICSVDWQKYIQYGEAFVRYETTGYRIHKMVSRHYVPVREGRLYRKTLETCYEIVDGRYITSTHELYTGKVNVNYSPKKKIMFTYFKGSTYELGDEHKYEEESKNGIFTDSYRGSFNGRDGITIYGYFRQNQYGDYQGHEVNRKWVELFKNLIANKDKIDDILLRIIENDEDIEHLKYLVLNRKIQDILDPLSTLRYGLSSWYPNLYNYVYNKFLDYTTRRGVIEVFDDEYHFNISTKRLKYASKNINIEYGSFLNIVYKLGRYREVIFVSTNITRF